MVFCIARFGSDMSQENLRKFAFEDVAQPIDSTRQRSSEARLGNYSALSPRSPSTATLATARIPIFLPKRSYKHLSHPEMRIGSGGCILSKESARPEALGSTVR